MNGITFYEDVFFLLQTPVKLEILVCTFRRKWGCKLICFWVMIFQLRIITYMQCVLLCIGNLKKGLPVPKINWISNVSSFYQVATLYYCFRSIYCTYPFAKNGYTNTMGCAALMIINTINLILLVTTACRQLTDLAILCHSFHNFIPIDSCFFKNCIRISQLQIYIFDDENTKLIP